MKLNIKVSKLNEISENELTDIADLQENCFSDINKKEAKEDFYALPVYRILAYHGSTLVGQTGVYKRNIKFLETNVVLGG